MWTPFFFTSLSEIIGLIQRNIELCGPTYNICFILENTIRKINLYLFFGISYSGTWHKIIQLVPNFFHERRCDEQILCVDYKYVSCGAQICLCGEQEESDKNTLEWISEK